VRRGKVRWLGRTPLRPGAILGERLKAISAAMKPPGSKAERPVPPVIENAQFSVDLPSGLLMVADHLASCSGQKRDDVVRIILSEQEAWRVLRKEKREWARLAPEREALQKKQGAAPRSAADDEIPF
jgi:hypothetical protein